MQLLNTLSIATLAAFFSGSVMAADCYTDKTAGDASSYWSLRERMCYNIDCAYQQECSVSQNGITLRRLNRGTKAGFPSCWDATENIINQCVVGQNNGGGEWKTDEEYYQFYRN